MTLQQKLQSDLVNEQLALEVCRTKLESAKAAIREHEIRLDYIRGCLSIETAKGNRKGVADSDSARGVEGDVDIEQAIKQAFKERPGRQRVQAVVARVIELGYGSPDIAERVRKNVSSFLLRKVKSPDISGFRKAGRGLYEYADLNGGAENGKGLHL